jgi:hypothetical protein
VKENEEIEEVKERSTQHQDTILRQAEYLRIQMKYLIGQKEKLTNEN